MQIPEMEQKTQKNLFAFEKIAVELGVANSRYLEQDICHCQSMC